MCFVKLIYTDQFIVRALCLGEQIFTSNPNLPVHYFSKPMEIIELATGQSHWITMEIISNLENVGTKILTIIRNL